VQLSDGSLASAHRSTGQTWTLGAQCAFFTHASNHFRGQEPELARRAEEAAYRALSSFRRWQRDGPYSPVENRLPPGHRVGYERYTADGHYANLAAALLAVAVSNGLNSPFTEPSGGREASLLLEHDPIFRAVLHNGPYSMHFNARPAPDYDAFGLVDVTFGPGRFLQFASSAKHLESGRLLNLGMAGGSGSSQTDLALTGRMDGGLAPPRLELEARDRGSPYRYRFAARVETEGVYVEETTPGLEDPKSLLIPYLRDPGTGTLTAAKVEAGMTGGVAGMTVEGAGMTVRLGAREWELRSSGLYTAVAILYIPCHWYGRARVGARISSFPSTGQVASNVPSVSCTAGPCADGGWLVRSNSRPATTTTLPRPAGSKLRRGPR
jgi:hypothetical protein